MSEKYLVKFGPRVKKVEVDYERPEPFRVCLEEAVRMAMALDPFMRQHSEKGFFLIQEDENGIDVEIDDSTHYWDVKVDQPIRLMLHSTISLDIPVQGQTAQQPQKPHSAVPPAVSNYLERMGMRVHKVPDKAEKGNALVPPEASTSNCERSQHHMDSAGEHQTRSSTPRARGPAEKPTCSTAQTPRALASPQAPSRNKRRVRSPSPEGEYLERVMKRQEENRAALQQVFPSNAPKLRTATRKQGKKKGTETIERRVMPSRGAKAKKKPEEVEPQLSDDEDDPVLESPELAPVLTEKVKVVQAQVVGNFHKKKDHRPIGQRITKFTPLPPFPRDLRQALEKGVYDTKLMNKFLRDHVLSVCKTLDITKGEYSILGDQVSKRLKSMQLVHPTCYTRKVKKKLSDSIRQVRYYPKKKAARAAQRRAKKAQEQADQSQDEEAAKDEVTAGQEGDKDEADGILQRPVLNKESVKKCLSSSTTRIPYIKSHTVMEVLEKYPCFKEADLLIHEYSLRIPLPLSSLQENFNSSLGPLSYILNETDSLEDELSKIMLYHKTEKFFSGGELHLPSIQFCDAANRNAVPLNNIPDGQAPAIVIVHDGSQLLSVTLIFDGSILTTAKSPTAFDCIALLLSGYWVFHINYPNPYLQHLESFEAILHGNVPEKAPSVSKYSKMDEFFRKLMIVMN